MSDDLVPVQFTEGLEEMIASWIETRADDDLGLCLLCGVAIRSEDEFIPGTVIHSCAEGLSFAS